MAIWSGRYTKAGQPARWVAVEIESEEEAARRVLPPPPEGWALDDVARGDLSEGSSPLDAPDQADADPQLYGQGEAAGEGTG